MTAVPNGEGKFAVSTIANMFDELSRRTRGFSDLQAVASDALTHHSPDWRIDNELLSQIKDALCDRPDLSRVGMVQYLLQQDKLNLGGILIGRTAEPFMRGVLEGNNISMLFRYPGAFAFLSDLWLSAMIKVADPKDLPRYLKQINQAALKQKNAIRPIATDGALKAFITIAPTFNPKPWHYQTLDCLLGMTGHDVHEAALYNPGMGHNALGRKPWIAQALRQRGMLVRVPERTPHLTSYARPVAIVLISAALGAAAMFGLQRLLSFDNQIAPAPIKQVKPAEPKTDVSMLSSQYVKQLKRA